MFCTSWCVSLHVTECLVVVFKVRVVDHCSAIHVDTLLVEEVRALRHRRFEVAYLLVGYRHLCGVALYFLGMRGVGV